MDVLENLSTCDHAKQSEFITDLDNLLESIDKVRKSSKGQYFENISAQAQKDFGWDEGKVQCELDLAVENGNLTVVNVRNKLSYRAKGTSGAIIRDATENVHCQTDSAANLPETSKVTVDLLNHLDDYADLKKHVLTKIGTLECLIHSNASAIIENQNTGSRNFDQSIQNGDPNIQLFSPTTDCAYAYVNRAQGHVPTYPRSQCADLIEGMKNQISSLEATVTHQRTVIDYLMRKGEPTHFEQSLNDQDSKLSSVEVHTNLHETITKPQTSVDIQSENNVKSKQKDKSTKSREIKDNRREPNPPVKTNRSATSTEQSERSSDKSDKTIERKKVVLVGDSHYNNIDERRLRQKHYTTVRNHPGASSTDLLDHIRPVLRGTPDHIVYHGFCNDLDRPNVDSMKNLEKLHKLVQEHSPNSKLTISLLFPRDDQKGMKEKVTDLNKKITAYCAGNSIETITNSNVRLEHLGLKKIHLSREGLKIFAGNIVSYLRKNK